MKVEVGTYDHPREVGYRGWVAFDRTVAFENLDGEVVVFPKISGR
jgi:hypothetical protein